MNESLEAPVNWAMSFANRGWPVLPLHYPLAEGQCSCRNLKCSSIAKHPMTKNGLKNAQKGPATVLNWWKNSPQANIGILTGEESGLIVLDIDPRHGGDSSLKQLENEFGKLPKTLSVKTGGNGYHYYFKHPGGKVPNKANLRDGVDIRGDGGYIVAPPSTHASLSTYSWLDANAELAPIPDWLLNLIQNRKCTKVTSSAPVNQFKEGGRNASLFSIAGFLKSKGLPKESMSDALIALNQSLCYPPLEQDEVAKIAVSIGRYQEEEWKTPCPLPLEPVAPEMQPEMLPDGLRGWCVDIAERMQVPLEFAAGPAIVTVASLLGRRISIHPKTKDNWEVLPNLWGVLIAPPGSMKSPAMSSILKPIQNLAVKAREEFVTESKRIEAEKTVAKAEIDALKDALKTAVKSGKIESIANKKSELEEALRAFDEKFDLIETRYMMNDPTIEKLLTILQENPQGLLLYRDELSGWMENMFKSGREGDREFFLESWNGDTPYSMDRIGRGSVFVDGLCLSVLGGLQPTKFESYVAALAKGGKNDDGLLQRFQILLYPEKRKTWKKIDRSPDTNAVKTVDDIFHKIVQIPLPKRNDDGIERVRLRFSDDAQKLFDGWYENLEMRILSGLNSPILENHLSKYRSLMPSLALIFQMLETFTRSSEKPSEIDRKSVELAIKWCEFLELHAIKAYGEHLNPEMVSARRLLAKIKSGNVKDFDRCRDVYRYGWKGLSSQTEIEGAIRVLKKYGFARSEMLSPPTGRRFEVIRLHPSLRLA